MKCFNGVRVCAFLIFMFACNKIWAGKEECRAYHAKLMNIQSQQKLGHSLKKSEKLAQKEAKARKKWWDCTKGKIIASENTDVKPSTMRAIKKAKKSSVKTVSQPTKKILQNTKQPALIDDQSIAIKEVYSGEKQENWLRYYQAPKQCKHPESYQRFVWCAEFKQRKVKAFEKEYTSKALK